MCKALHKLYLDVKIDIIIIPILKVCVQGHTAPKPRLEPRKFDSKDGLLTTKLTLNRT